MPEGDSYARAAARLRPVLIGRTLEAVDGDPAVRPWAPRLVGRTVTGIRTHGKHLLIDLEGDVTIHTWLGMPGRWLVRRRDERLPDPGAVRLALTTATHVAVCLSAPVVEVERRRVIDQGLERLGPDVLAPGFDAEALRERAGALPPSTTAAELLVDQRVLAGVGNEYRSEVLFLEGVHPLTPLFALGPEGVARLAARARRLMLPNAAGTGRRRLGDGLGGGTWVYRRTGRPCRRCGTVIVSAAIGRPARSVWWCPSCQPGPAGR
jgi:endonuclease-8